jgi:hypothetical protein
VRGYAEWNPAPATLEIIEHVREIIAEYTMALTIRQIFYRLVGKYGFEKTEQAYDRLGEYINRARRAGVVDWELIRDDGDIVPEIPGWTGPHQFWATVEALAEDYFRTPEGDVYVEVWVETAGMAPQIQSVANEFGVRVIGSGGFSSSTARRNTAVRLNDAETVHILLIGDYDPSGQSIMDSAAEDVRAFGAEAEFERLAVTPEQAAQYNLISAPQKQTDKRGEYMAETYQAEALDPDVLSGIVRTKLLGLVGQESLAEAEKLTRRERAAILAYIEKINRARRR